MAGTGAGTLAGTGRGGLCLISSRAARPTATFLDSSAADADADEEGGAAPGTGPALGGISRGVSPMGGRAQITARGRMRGRSFLWRSCGFPPSP